MLLSLVPAMGVTASAADTSWTMVNTYDQLKAALSNQNPPDNIKLGSDNIGIYSNEHIVKLVVNEAPVVEPDPTIPKPPTTTGSGWQ